MVNHTFRLDAHEKQLQQLRSDVTAIKDSLKVLEQDPMESAEFRKMVFAWMKQQNSDLFGSVVDCGEEFTNSSPQSASDGDLYGDCSRSIGPSFNANEVMLPGTLGSRTLVGQCEEQAIFVDQNSTNLGPPARLGFNMVGKSLREGKNGSRDAVLIPVPPMVFPSIDSGLQLNSKSIEGVSIQSASRLEGSKDFLIPVFLFQLSPPTRKQFLMTTVVSTFIIGDRRLVWKGGIVPIYFLFKCHSSTIPYSHVCWFRSSVSLGHSNTFSNKYFIKGNFLLWMTLANRVMSFGMFALIGTFFPRKLSGIDWQYKTASHVAEVVVGSALVPTIHSWLGHGQWAT